MIEHLILLVHSFLYLTLLFRIRDNALEPPDSTCNRQEQYQ